MTEEQSETAIEKLEEYLRNVMTEADRKPLNEEFPRNDVGSRLTVSMQEAFQLAKFRLA